MQQIPRLFVEPRLSAGAEIPLSAQQGHYLQNVLRLQPGAELRLLDDQTGEWAAELAGSGRRQLTARLRQQVALREQVPDLWLLAAPIRPERFQWLAEKATELGVRRFAPVISQRVNHARQNPARLRAHMVEAAEQCERTALPELAEARPLVELLADWPAQRTLIFADEAGGESMAAIRPAPAAAILIGPEGGFTDAERQTILRLPQARRLTLGPRVLRADTAAIAAIAQFQLLADNC